MVNPIETLLDLASKIEDFPEDVSGEDAVDTIRAATEALEERLAEAERDAERYRWLRDNAKRTMLMRLPASYEPDAIDRTIDAARAADSATAVQES